MAGNTLNISPDKFADLIAAVARVEAKQDAILTQIDKSETHFQTQLDEMKLSIASESKRVDDLETDKKRIMSIAAAAMLLISCLAWFGGDYVKAQIFPTHQTTQLASNL